MTKEIEELKRLKTAADTWQFQRIADALEEILRMVKTDQERAQEARIHYKMEEDQEKYTAREAREKLQSE